MREDELEIFTEGDSKKVFSEILNFKNNQENNTRPVLIILGGAMRGVYGGGGITALNDLGLTNNFYTVVGVSTGAPVAAYFLTGQGKLGTSIYYEECLTSYFMNWWRVFLKAKKFMDVNYLGKIWRGEMGDKKLDLQKLKNSKTKCLIAVTEFERGGGELIEINDLQDPISPIVASCSIPFVTDSKVKCGDKYYTDGAMSLSFPVEETIKKINPTSILVFPNRDINYRDGILVKIWENIVYYSYPHSQHKKLDLKESNYDKELKFLRNSNIPYSIIWCDKQVSAFTRDKKVLMSAKDRYYDFLKTLIKQGYSGTEGN